MRVVKRNGILPHEIACACRGRAGKRGSPVAAGVFLGMFAFCAYFILQTMDKSAFGSRTPFFLQQSYFATLSVYRIFCHWFMAAYVLFRYREITFAQVHHNAWYALVHLQYKVSSLVIGKLLAQYLLWLCVYTVGFLTSAFLTSFLKVAAECRGILQLYGAGTLEIAVFMVVANAFSVLTRDVRRARYLTGGAAVFLLVLEVGTGFYAKIVDADAMRQMTTLFDPSVSLYTSIVLAAGFAALVWTVARAADISRHFNAMGAEETDDLNAMQSADISIAIDAGSGAHAVRKAAKALARQYAKRPRANVFSAVMDILVTCVVVFMLLVNLGLLAFSYASPERETSIMGYIPYLFQSETMEPSVLYNDLAFFERVDGYVELSPGHVILYKDDANIVQVRRILTKEMHPVTGQVFYTADVDNAPAGSAKGSFFAQVCRGQVYARLVGTNHFLGMVFLFANTIIGRMLFLMIPTILIFYAKQISRFFRRAFA